MFDVIRDQIKIENKTAYVSHLWMVLLPAKEVGNVDGCCGTSAAYKV